MNHRLEAAVTRSAERPTRAAGAFRRFDAPRTRLGPIVMIALAFVAGSAHAEVEPDSASTPRAEANDQTTPAGTMVAGELVVELEAVEAEWFPRGPDGPRVVTPAFAEVGHVPTVPGPLIRAAAGTPIVVVVTNRLDRPIQVRGLVDRDDARPAGVPADAPGFLFADSLVVPVGETRTARFTPGREVSSFYYARLVPPEGALAPPNFVPGGIADEGAFMGALVIDPAGASSPPGERLLMITRWGSRDEPGSLDTTWKMMVNGRSWPFTERIELSVGDTASWRVINASSVDHPMHLHGFYFTVDGTGDTQADTVFAADARREAVTEMMQEYSSLRLRWVPERPGNWLFHCHLIRHMGELQRFEADRRSAPAPATRGPGEATHSDAEAGHAADGAGAMPEMDGMAGLITGITVHPRPGASSEDPEPIRRIELWTGRRDGIFGDQPELGFIVQEGADPPSPDSIRLSGSPLVLTRGEPTEIVVHNRLTFPLSVHWHGLELRSLYDGVGHWSGTPGSVRPPIPPGEMQRVVIEPVRAGTFFYHTHGEPGHELQQGLYGAFLVMEEGEDRDPDRDRVYVLGSRGAQIDAPPAINGELRPAAERFEPGRTYRLRFIHISPDEFKQVRLLRDDQPVRWTPLAKDGADLPETRRVPAAAELGIGVGEAYDFLWTPEEPGVHVLEVRTAFYPSRGGSVVQRQALAVGEVSDSAIRAATTGSDVPIVELGEEERAGYVGTFVGRLVPAHDPRDWIFAVWAADGGLFWTMDARPDPDGEESFLIPLGDHTFMPGRRADGLTVPTDPDLRIRFDEELSEVEIEQAGELLFRLDRVEALDLSDEELRPFVGTYGATDLPFDLSLGLTDVGLQLGVPGLPPARLTPISRTRFQLEGVGVPPGTLVRFTLESDLAAALVLIQPGEAPARFSRTER